VSTEPEHPDADGAPAADHDAAEERRLDERRNLRLLLAMVAALVLIPMLLTIAALTQELITHRSG
jgi:hypothetical protein